MRGSITTHLLWAKLRQLFATSALLTVFALLCSGQSDLTTVQGTIGDPSGAVIPNATVTIKNQATGSERKGTSNESGGYVIPSVAAGAVTLIVEAPGFKKFEQSGNVLQANVTATLNATLIIGNATETVQVTSEAPPIQADSATLGRDITTKQIRDLQLNGRNPLLLSLLKPGVTGGAWRPYLQSEQWHQYQRRAKPGHIDHAGWRGCRSHPFERNQHRRSGCGFHAGSSNPDRKLQRRVRPRLRRPDPHCDKEWYAAISMARLMNTSGTCASMRTRGRGITAAIPASTASQRPSASTSSATTSMARSSSRRFQSLIATSSSSCSDRSTSGIGRICRTI